MTALFLGVAVGFFMAAFINYKYNTSKWIDTKYLVWIGIIALLVSLVLGWSDIQEGLKDSAEIGRTTTARLIL